MMAALLYLGAGVGLFLFGLAGGEKFIKISGSDAHQTMDVARGGVISEKPISNNDELIAFLTENPEMERIETP